MVSRPPPQKMDTADADTYFGMAAEADQGPPDLIWPQHQHLLSPVWPIAV
jgi:hypothetical protein